jgi:hypothetical protein
MTKEKEEDTESNKKSLVENIDDVVDNNFIDYNDDIDDIDDNIDEEYYALETYTLLQKNILDYVEKNNMPLCEYLSIQRINIFLNSLPI